MIPREKIEAIVANYDNIEKELSSQNIDPKTFAKKSKEYANIGNIIDYARKYLKFENDKKELEYILNDKKSDNDMKSLAEKELEELQKKKNSLRRKIKNIFITKG